MPTLIWDIEADSLTPTKIHCIAVRNHETGDAVIYGPEQLQDGLKHLATATTLVGHNILSFDLPALKTLLGWEPEEVTEILDTVIWSRFLFPDLSRNDLKWFDEDDDEAEFKALIGSHSLEAWGKRLGVRKKDFQGPWDICTQEMLDYCLADTATNLAIYRHFLGLNRTDFTALKIEHDFARICDRMTTAGVCFDVEKARELHAKLQIDLQTLTDKITADIPPEIEVMKKPAYYTATWPGGVTQQFPTKGAADTYRKLQGFKPRDCSIEPGPIATKSHPFNLNSRKQVRDLLFNRFNWLSPALTEGGEKLVGTLPPEQLAREYGKLSEELLRECPFDLGQQIADYYLVNKISTFLLSKNEEKGWLTMCGDGRIHGKIISIGAASFRCTHSSPNIAQTPHTSLDKEKRPLFGIAGRYGADCRQLFKASPGYVMVGADLSGIEAVALAHYLYPYDHGEFARKIAAGDIHSANVAAIKQAGFGISRSDSKTAFYGYLYGSGDLKMGTILVSSTQDAVAYYQDRRDWYRRNPGKNNKKLWSDALKARRQASPEEAALIEIGSKVKRALETGITGLGDLVAALKDASVKKYLNVGDRQVPIRSTHAALNVLLQSFSALIMKKWVCLTDKNCQKAGVVYRPLLTIHDELDSEMLPEYVDPYRKICLDAISQAGEYYKVRLPVTGEVKQGGTWLDVH